MSTTNFALGANTKIVDIVPGFNNGINGPTVCAIDSVGNAYCWGENGAYQFGDGTTTDSNVPVSIMNGGLSGKKIDFVDPRRNYLF